MPRTHAIPSLLAVAVAACGGPESPAVIGAAYVVPDLRFLEVAQGAIDSLVAGTGTSIRLRVVHDVPAGAPDEADLTAAVHQARQIVGLANLVGVVGHAGSRDALLAAPIYEEARIPLIVPTATSSLLREAGPWVFMLAPIDSVQGEFIAEFVSRDLGAGRVDIVYIPDEYGTGLRDATARALAQRGVTVGHEVPVWQRWACPPDAAHNEYAGALAPVLDGPAADVVVLAARPAQAGCTIRYLHERLPHLRFVAGDGTVPDDVLFRRAGPGLDALYLVAFWHPDLADARGADFVARFERIVGRPPVHQDAMLFDAFVTMAHAAREAGADPRRVRDYLRSLGRERPPLHGVTGPITFDPAKPGSLVITRIHEGRWIPVRDR